MTAISAPVGLGAIAGFSWGILLALAFLGPHQQLARAQDLTSDSEAEVSSEVCLILASGASLGFLQRADFGDGASERFFFEPVLHLYLPTPLVSVFLRSSLHGSYIASQNEMPAGLKIEEKDAYIGLMAGLVFDWIVVPSFSLGMQYIHRSIGLRTSESVEVKKDIITRNEKLYSFITQAGIGLPLAQGLIVLEPFLRQRFIIDDTREGLSYGLEITFQIY